MSQTASRPDNRKRILYATLIVVVIVIVAGIGLASRSVVPPAATKSVGESKLKVGSTAPQFTAQTNAGPFDLNAVPTPVLLEVFATWCPHCQRETAVLNALAAKYAGKLSIVAVSGDAFDINHTGPETQADVNTFGQQFSVRYPIAFDPDLRVAEQYLQGGFPTIVVIGKDKKIAYIGSGDTPQPVLEKAIAPVL